MSTIGRMQWGANALSAPTTPANRVAVVDRSKVDPQIVKAAEGMEAMFLDYVMKVMRESVPKNELDGSNAATDIYTSMRDSEFAQAAAKQGGIGLADQIIANFQSQLYNFGTGQVNAPANRQSAVQARTGGTNEGQPIPGKPSPEHRDVSDVEGRASR